MNADETYSAGYELEQFGSVDDLPGIEEWYRRAAAAGSTDATARLGLIMEGATRARCEDRSQYVGDYAQAGHWYRRAAEQGNTFAMYLLGRRRAVVPEGGGRSLRRLAGAGAPG